MDTFAALDSQDMLREIFMCLPIKTLLRFKSVCKYWHSVITETSFLNRYTEASSPTATCSALILQGPKDLRLLTLDPRPNATFPSNGGCGLSSLLNYPESFITQSCNGFLLCGNSSSKESELFVLNPTTKWVSTIPSIEAKDGVLGFGLAFDPSRSTHYKVVCMRTRTRPILLYSSQSRMWKECRGPSPANLDSKTRCVYWNGALHWLCNRGRSHYFSLDDERLRRLRRNVMGAVRFVGALYFGESGDHLHMIPHNLRYQKNTEFDVYEMERDHSMWHLKFHVDLTTMSSVDWSLDFKDFSILTIVRSEEDEYCLVIQSPGNIVRYDVHKKIIKKLFWLVPAELKTGDDVFQYIATFSSIE